MYYSWCMDLKRYVMYSLFTQWFTVVYYVGFLNHICYYQAFQIKACMFSTCHVYHYSDVIMGAIASQITSLTIVYSTVYSGTDQRKHKAPRNWPLCGEFTGDRWIPRTNGQSRGKCFNLMTSSCIVIPFNCELSWTFCRYLTCVTIALYVPLYPDTMPGPPIHSTCTLPYTIPTLHVDVLWSLNNPAFTNWRWMGSMGSVWRMGVDLTPTMPVHLVYIFANWQGLSRWRKL